MSSGGHSQFRRVGSLLVCIVFAVGSAVGIGHLVSRLIIPADWAEATGRLVSVERGRKGHDQITQYHRSYSFEAADGGTYTARSTRYSEGDLGSTAPIRYDPADPTQAEVVGFWDRFILYLLVLGLVLLLIGTVTGAVQAIRTMQGTRGSVQRHTDG